jgi:TolA-binding protein
MNSYVRNMVILIILVSVSPTLKAQQNAESDDFSYALKLYNEKFYDLAAQQFSRFGTRYPGSDKIAEAGYYAGMSLFNLSEYETARVEFQRVAVDFPNHKRAADSWFMIGESYGRANNLPEAAKAYEMVKILHPKHQIAPQSILRAGRMYQELGQSEKAEQLYILIQNRYLESSEYFAAVLAHGSLKIIKGETKRAEEKLQKVLEGNSSAELKAEALLYLGKMYRSQGFLEKAKLRLRDILSKYSTSDVYVRASIILSDILLQQGALNEVLTLANKSLKYNLSPDERLTLFEQLGDAHYLGKQYALSSSNYEKSHGDHTYTNYVLRSLKLALSRSAINDINGALGVLETVIKDSQCQKLNGYVEAVDLFLQLCFDHGRSKKGISLLSDLERKKKLDENGYRWMAKLLRTEGSWNAVIQKFEPVVYTQPENPDLDSYVFDLAVAYQNTGTISKSEQYYQKLIDEFPASELFDLAKEKLDHLRRYHLTEESVSVSGLALLIGEVIKGKDEGALQYRLGKLYFENLKNYPEALAQFKMALQSQSQTVRKGDIYFYSGLANQYLGERYDISQAERDRYLNAARENYSSAMENLADASDPEFVSWKFVELGIRLDQSTPQKQISYYTTLLTKYPNSIYSEEWHKRLAKLYFESDSLQAQATEQYGILTQKFPESPFRPEYLFARAELEQKLKRTDVTDIYKNIVLEYPASNSAAKALYNLGILAEEKRNFKEAIQFYSKLKQDYFYTNLAMQASDRLGDVLLLGEMYDQAIEIYRIQLSFIPPDDVVLNNAFLSGRQINVYYKLGRAYHALEQWRLAQQNLANFLLSSADGPYIDDARFLLGEVYLALGDEGSAIASLQKVTKNDAALNKLALNKIAAVYFSTQDYEKSATAFNAYAEQIINEEGEQEARAKAIVAAIRSGNIQQAEKFISSFNKKFKKNTNYAASFTFEFGNWYRSNKEFKKAQSFFSSVLKKYSKSQYADDAEYFLALTYITQNKQKEALDILANFTKNYPNSENLGSVYNTLGSIYFRSEKYESALTSFKRAIDKPLDREQRQQVMSNLIRTYTFVNFWDAALALTRDYINEYPEAADIIDKKILIGRAYTYLNQIDRAVEQLKETRLIADSEKEPEIQFYVGDAYFKSGQYENAIAEFVKIPFLSRKTKLQWEASALYYSGQAYEKLGRIDDAVRMYQEIVKRPGIDLILKKDAQKRIQQIQG